MADANAASHGHKYRRTRFAEGSGCQHRIHNGQLHPLLCWGHVRGKPNVELQVIA